MKQKWIHFLSYVLVAMLSAGAAFYLAETASGDHKLGELQNLIEDRFIGELDMEFMEDAAADAMVKATGDRWSYYIPASEYQSHMELI